MTPAHAVDGQHLRAVLGHYPTGVSLVTGRADDGELIGLTVGSFTSISLDPPLVGFFVGKSSTTWPRIRTAGKFCVNVLATGQHGVASLMASRDRDKGRGMRWQETPSGGAMLDGCVAWIDCGTESLVSVGDHDLVVGAVTDLGTPRDQEPLIFHRGTFTGVQVTAHALQARRVSRAALMEPPENRCSPLAL